MRTVLFLVSLAVVNGIQISEFATKLSGRQLANYVNSVQNGWVADPEHKFVDVQPQELRSLFGLMEPHDNMPTLGSAESENLTGALPSEFDAREHWPECREVIADIRDQSNCGSCWAVAATAAMSDRICIVTKGQKKVKLSAQDLMSCCHFCGMGCHGGLPEVAWAHYWMAGIVSGGDFQGEGCRPYPFAPCEHHVNGTHYPQCAPEIASTPQCETSCRNTKLEYQKEKHYGGFPYHVRGYEEPIMKEIMTNGPVEAGLTVYTDLLAYKSGVYKHTAGGLAGGHAVRIIGWGEEGGEKYWLVANSWNEDWGDKGVFKIKRGTNECSIESRIVAGIPKEK